MSKMTNARKNVYRSYGDPPCKKPAGFWKSKSTLDVLCDTSLTDEEAAQRLHCVPYDVEWRRKKLGLVPRDRTPPVKMTVFLDPEMHRAFGHLAVDLETPFQQLAVKALREFLDRHQPGR